MRKAWSDGVLRNASVRELLRVSRVDPVRTINPKVTQYTVTGKTVDSPSVTRQLHTTNVLLATLCKRGADTQRDVWVTWKPDVKYGPQLRLAALDETKFSHDADSNR